MDASLTVRGRVVRVRSGNDGGWRVRLVEQPSFMSSVMPAFGGPNYGSGVTAIVPNPPATMPAYTGTEIAIGVTAPALLTAVAMRQGQPLGPTNDQEIEDFIYDALDLIPGASDVEARCQGGRAMLRRDGGAPAPYLAGQRTGAADRDRACVGFRRKSGHHPHGPPRQRSRKTVVQDVTSGRPAAGRRRARAHRPELRAVAGNKAAAARALGLDRKTLYRKLTQHRIAMR